MAAGHAPVPVSMHRWFPAMVTESPISLSKGHLAAQTWWAQVGSNHRLLACKAEYGKEYAQLPELVHASELRKPCLEVPWGAWESLHGGSRKWFPEQPADPSLEKRVGAGRQGYRSCTRRMAVTGARKDSADQLHTRYQIERSVRIATAPNRRCWRTECRNRRQRADQPFRYAARAIQHGLGFAHLRRRRSRRARRPGGSISVASSLRGWCVRRRGRGRRVS
jgi:hypothetical protein